MAFYAYKNIANRLPAKYTSNPDFDASADYDGGYWVATSEWIDDLQSLLKDAVNMLTSISIDPDDPSHAGITEWLREHRDEISTHIAAK